MTEQDPVGQRDAQAVLQQIADQVRRDHEGDDVEVVREALRRRIAEAGMAPQPVKWVDDLGGEIAGRREMVVDRRLDRSEPEEADLR
jgi:hypothetical protein